MPQKNYSAQEMQDWWNQYVQDQARQAAAAGPTLVDQFNQAYMRSLGNAFNANIGAPLGLNLGGGLYRSTNPALAGQPVSGLTGTNVPPMLKSPATSIANTVTAPAVTTPAVTNGPVVASNSAAKTPQFITPYSTRVTGPGAYGESDVSPFRKTKTWI